MLKYLVILLDDNATSYCHYLSRESSRPIPLDTLQKGIVFAMKNDLKIQYVLPEYDLPQAYRELMDSMYHDNIGPLGQAAGSDVIVAEGIKSLVALKNTLDIRKRYIIRTSVSAFLDDHRLLKELFDRNVSANIVFTDIESFSENSIESYRIALKSLAQIVDDAILGGHNVNTNLLTDRIALDGMNNCGAGEISITLAPDGKFYPCLAFYYDRMLYYDLGNVDDGLNIRNRKLYTLGGAPLCKRCDAYHCKRCVWLNKKLTCEVNIPSRQQCVMAHIERNASRDLLEAFHNRNLLRQKSIKAIDYVDPFDKYNNI